MYDFRKEPHVHSSHIKGFYRKHEAAYHKYVYSQPKETLCRLWCELSRWKWNEEILGPFKGYLAAITLLEVIEDRIGRYELLRYFNVVCEKRMTEDEYFRWAVKRCFDTVWRSSNPLYWDD